MKVAQAMKEACLKEEEEVTKGSTVREFLSLCSRLSGLREGKTEQGGKCGSAFPVEGELPVRLITPAD